MKKGRQMRMKIYKTSKDKTVKFAVDELKKYLKLMEYSTADIRLGTYEELGIAKPKKHKFDDEIYIDTMQALISGCNPRSVLLVYRYLYEYGC